MQVFPAHTETNPFNIDGDDKLFERLKNKENDPMSMSFYQEKDDDTCERFSKIESHVDLNAVQPLPDSDDEDIQPNGVCENVNENKENICPDETSNLLGLEQGQEPNNDIIRFDDRSEIVGNNVPSLDSYMDFSFQNTNNMQNYRNTDFECNITQEPVVQTDTPESHKLLFEQIPEIPDGKSSELGFTNEDLLDPSDSDKDGRVITPQDETSQDIEMEGKFDESPSEEVQQEIENVKSEKVEENEIIIETALSPEATEKLACENIGPAQETELDDKPSSPEMAEKNVIVEVHETPNTKHKETNAENVIKEDDSIIANGKEDSELPQIAVDAPEIPYEEEQDSELQKLETEFEAESPAKSPVPSDSLINSESLLPKESPLPQESLLPGDSSFPQESPLPQEVSLLRESPLSQEALLSRNSPISSDSPLPQDNLKPVESPLPPESPIPSESLLPQETMHARESPLPQDMQSQESTLPEATFVLRDSPMLQETVSQESSIPLESPLPKESLIPSESPLPATSPAPVELVEHSSSSLSKSPDPSERENLEATSPTPSPLPSHTPVPSHNSFEPVPAEVPLPRESPVPADVTLPQENIDINKGNEIPQGELLSASPLPNESMTVKQTLPVEKQTSPLPTNLKQEWMLEETQNKVFVTAEDQEPKHTERESPNPLVQHCVSPMPVQSTENTETLILTEEPQSTETSVPTEPTHTEVESKLSSESLVAEAPAGESIHIELDTAIVSPAPVDEIKETTPSAPSPLPVSESVEAKEITEVQKPVSEVSAPAPDIVPEERPRTELVTDIDIGIPESRAQEICVPVTNVIQHDDVVQPGATPPPTPAIEPAKPPALGEAPIAAATAAAAAAAVAVTAVAATAAKAKSTGSPKKSPTTPTAKAAAPKTASKTTPATRTPASATKRATPASAATTPRTPAAAAPRAAAPRTPASAPKASPAARPAAKSAPAPATKPAPKPVAAQATKPAPKPAAAPVPARTAPVSRSAPVARVAAKAPATKSTTAAPAKPATATSKPTTAPASRPAARPAPTARPATAARPPSATALAAKPKEVKPKVPGAPAKPLTNGEVKASAKPASRAPRPAPRPAAPAAAAPKYVGFVYCYLFTISQTVKCLLLNNNL